MRRILLVLSVAALMAAMMVASAMPVFASHASLDNRNENSFKTNFGQLQSADQRLGQGNTGGQSANEQTQCNPSDSGKSQFCDAEARLVGFHR